MDRNTQGGEVGSPKDSVENVQTYKACIDTSLNSPDGTIYIHTKREILFLCFFGKCNQRYIIISTMFHLSNHRIVFKLK